GALEHKDSLGTGSVIKSGELQRMSAGTGIRHSEFNPSESEWVHLYQIWLLPNHQGVKPSYEQRVFAEEEKAGLLRLVAAPDGADESLRFYQDARVYLATLNTGQTIPHELADGRAAWVQVLRGAVALNGHQLETGDGGAVSDEKKLEIA